MEPLLSIRQLRVNIETPGPHPPIRAVDGVDLGIVQGQIHALVGESGCGKTTLALSVGRLLPPRARIVSGRIFFEGADLTSLPEDKLRTFRGGRIAYIFQDPMSALNPVMSVEEQLMEALHLHERGRAQATRRRAMEFLSRVKIPAPERVIRQYPHQLSGGLRQRVMIAMALAGSASLVIADEPTTALDVTTQAEILDLLKSLTTLGMALLLITHDLMGVAAASDRVSVMYAGRIVEEIPTKEFVQNASHPYAQALLSCCPRVGVGRQRLRAIPGSVPDLRFTPSGCPFHPRCPEAIASCSQKEPTLQLIGPAHKVSCFMRDPTKWGTS